MATSLQLTIALAAGGTLESCKISRGSTEIPQNGESCKSEQVVPGHNIFFMQSQAPLCTSKYTFNLNISFFFALVYLKHI